MTHFAVEPLYGSVWLAMIASVAVVAVIVWVTPPTDDPAKRKWLIVLRSVAALVLLLAATRPTLVRTDNRPAPAALVITVDTSRSMTLPDGDGGDRWTSQKDALARLLSGVATVDEMLEVHLLNYDSVSNSLGQAQNQDSIRQLADLIAKAEPVGDETGAGIKRIKPLQVRADGHPVAVPGQDAAGSG